ncbi:type II toxin-antitoxin system HicB family antitoxin [Lactobacillus xylocopicola]|uniref:HicB family protein n=1 Tax=Lactobacillus xylocopicola TaxID=2976676 RepID=A0ABM8BIE3_9LACO|nr:type II toxin-antitoxin system HicB family antitoxin [Lactobacillus xylocopicola]BDR61079.1 HicB family protein [Lactobacillus xylocopicola]
MTKLLVYPVLLHQEEKGYSVTVPDIPGALTEGDTQTEALIMAADAIGLMLEDQTEYPKATPLDNIKTGDGDFKALVTIDMDEFRRNNPKTVRKSVTVPQYLDKLGRKNGVNFSAILTKALRTELNI